MANKLPSYEDLMQASRSDLIALRNDVERAIKDSESEARKRALEEAKRVAAEAGFSLQDLLGNGGSKGRGKSANQSNDQEAKYRHPENPELTWSGRGRQPNWIKDHEANGGSKEDFLINA